MSLTKAQKPKMYLAFKKDKKKYKDTVRVAALTKWPAGDLVVIHWKSASCQDSKYSADGRGVDEDATHLFSEEAVNKRDF